MSTDTMNTKVKELRELRRMADELQAEIDSLQDSIKAELAARNVDTLTGTDWRVTWKTVTSSRLDSLSDFPRIAEIQHKMFPPSQNSAASDQKMFSRSLKDFRS